MKKSPKDTDRSTSVLKNSDLNAGAISPNMIIETTNNPNTKILINHYSKTPKNHDPISYTNYTQKNAYVSSLPKPKGPGEFINTQGLADYTPQFYNLTDNANNKSQKISVSEIGGGYGKYEPV
jgi:hypothetical protein